MGLDMYLNRYPKIGLSLEKITRIEEYFRWKEKGKDKEYSLEDWCGFKESDLPDEDTLKACEDLRHLSYAAWDWEKRFPNHDIHDQVGYWRKANAIHNWFSRKLTVEGIENCENYNVSRKALMALRDDCKTVLSKSKLIPGKVANGYTLEKGKWTANYEDGLVIEDSTTAEELLPTTSGFFFGSTEYNSWYLDDVKYTFDLCNKLLEETDFENYDLYYTASW